MKFLCTLIGMAVSFTVFCQDKADGVIVLPVKTAAPEHAAKLGEIKVGNNTMSVNCDYDLIIRQAKQKAADMGGNVVKITRLIEPAFVSKCYRICADVYYDSTLPKTETDKVALSQTTNPEHEDYAVLYIYRLRDTVVPEPAYRLHFNGDSVIYTVKSRSKDSIRVYKEGAVTLWAKTGKRVEKSFDVKLGEAYFIRCGLRQGEIWMNPVIELMDKNIGADEFKKLRRGKKDMDVKYLEQVH